MDLRMRLNRPGWCTTIVGLAWLVSVSLSVFAADPPSSVTTKSSTAGEWEIQLDQQGGWPEASASPGQHQLKAVLQPVGEGQARSVNTPYKIDLAEDKATPSSSSTTITPISPLDGLIDRNHPIVVFEIDDGIDGSGFSTPQSDSNSIDVEVTPAGAMTKYNWAISQRDDRQIAELSVEFDPQRMDLVGDQDYQIKVLAIDALGHSKRQSFNYRYVSTAKPAYALLGEKGTAMVRSCSYRQPVVVELSTVPIGNSPVSDNVLMESVAGSRLDITPHDQFQFPESVQREIMNAVSVNVSGPAELKESDAAQFTRRFEINAAETARALEPATIRVDVPEYVQITYRMRSTQAGCPNIDPAWSVSGGVITPGQFVFLDFDEVEDIRISAERRSVLLGYQVMRTVNIPVGSFTYYAQNLVLKFSLESANKEVELSTTQSSAELIAETGNSLTKPLKASGDQYEFVYEDIIEGWHSIQADLFALGYFLEPDSRVAREDVVLNKSELIKGPKPEIESAEYDYASQTLNIKISDQGTPAELLDNQLNIGGVILPLQLDKNGTLSLPLPQPKYDMSGVLISTDLAGQSATRELTIHGLDLYQDKNKARKQTSSGYRSTYVPPLAQNLGGGAYRETCPVNCNNKVARGILNLDGLNNTPDKNLKTGPAYWAEERKRLKEFNSRVRSLGVNYSSLRSSTCATRLEVGIKPPRKPCGPILHKDMEAPQIRAFSVYPDRGLFTAIISDVGTPLSELKVITTVADNTGYRRRGENASAYTFNTTTGYLQVEFPVKADRESLNVWLQVSDSGKNSASESRQISMPSAPPEIDLREWQVPDMNQTVGLFADVWDSSGIDEPLTRLSLDGTPCAAVYLYGGFGLRAEKYGEKATWYCRVQTTEGIHEFSATAVDTFGLRSTASLSFGQAYPPLIQDLKILTADPTRNGITVFSALVTDTGLDLDASGLEFRVDGKRIEQDKLFYDPVTGVFSVDGPINVERGFHRAQLIATDRGGNSVAEFLSFAYAGSGFEPQIAGDLVLNQVYLWELQNSNGDGLANPGELIRLFFSFTNTGSSSLEDLQFRVIIDDQRIEIEKPLFSHPRLLAHQQFTVPEGIDLRIAADLLSSEGLESKTIPLIIEVTDNQGAHWDLDGEFTVYQERAVFAASQVGADAEPTITFITPTDGQVFDFGSLIPALATINLQGRFTTGAASLDSFEIEIADDNGAVVFSGTPSLLGNGLFALNVQLAAGRYETSAEVRNQQGDTALESLVFELNIDPPPNQLPLALITSHIDGAVVDFGVISPAVANLVVQGTFDPVDSPLQQLLFVAVNEDGDLLFFGAPEILAPGFFQATIPVTDEDAGELEMGILLETEDGDSVDQIISINLLLERPPNVLPQVAVTSPVSGEIIRFDTPFVFSHEITILGTFDVGDSVLDEIIIPINSAQANVQILTPTLWQATITLPSGTFSIEPEIRTVDGDFVNGPEVIFTVLSND